MATIKAHELRKAILDSAGFSSIATDETGVIRVFGAGAERMLGYAAAEVVNTLRLADLLDPLPEAIAAGVEGSYAVALIRKDASRFAAVAAVTALRARSGELVGHLLIAIDEPRQPRLERAEPAVRTASERRNLLYVDDEPANVALVGQLIARRADVLLLSAESLGRGIESARSLRPDVILLNIDLPGIGALEFLKFVRADPGTQHAPVLALGADAAPAAVLKGLEAGFFHYLIKPLQAELFLEALSHALEFAARESEESR